MPRALIAVLIGLLVVMPAGEASARAKHGKPHRLTALKGSSTATLRAPKARRGRARPAYNRLVSLLPASRPAPKVPAAAAAPAAPASGAPALPTVPGLPGGPAAQSVSSPIVDPSPLGSFASVRARDTGSLSFTLSRPELAAGSVRLQFQNSGEDEHDLTVAAQSGGGVIATTSPVAPGQNATISTTLPAGRYRLYCSLFAHAQQGMQATLDVR